MRVSYSGYYAAFPRLKGGFDSRYPLHPSTALRLLGVTTERIQAEVAQLVEQYFRKVEVASSTLAFGSRNRFFW